MSEVPEKVCLQYQVGLTRGSNKTRISSLAMRIFYRDACLVLSTLWES